MTWPEAFALAALCALAYGLFRAAARRADQ